MVARQLSRIQIPFVYDNVHVISNRGSFFYVIPIDTKRQYRRVKEGVIQYALWLALIAAGIKGFFRLSGLVEPSYFWLIIAFVYGVSLLVFVLLAVFGNKNSENFIRLLLGTIVIKLFIYMVFVAAVIYLDKENANANVVLFLVLYFAYTLLEVGLLYKKISARN